MPELTRRSLLAIGVSASAFAATGGGLVAGVESGLLPGRIRLENTLHLGEVSGALPTGTPAPLTSYSFASTRRRSTVDWIVSAPRGTRLRGLPAVLVLHGRGGTARSAFDDLHLHAFLAAHVRAGREPMALVSVDGGTSSYWHPRIGADPLAMVTAELLPRMAALGLDLGRLGVLGWSMGGFGALLMARESAADRLGGHVVRTVAAGSPALFASARTTAGGAFDGPADFTRWGDLARTPAVGDVALHVSCGRDDAFRAMTERYRRHVHPTPAGSMGNGRHDVGYWRWLVPRQLAFLGDQLDG